MAKQETGRATKADRKEQARRERAELERKVARGRRNRWIAIGLVVVVVAGVAAYALTRPRTAAADPNDLLTGAQAQAEAAGCGAPENVGPYQPQSRDQEHITDAMPALSTYPSTPPASGPHNPITLGAGVYDSPPAIDRAMHSLEHGAVIVWYSPDVTGELDRLTAFYSGADVGSRVIVAPYDYPDQGAAGQLPAGTEMALVAWHNVERCAKVNVAAAFDFSSQYAAPPFGDRQYVGEAPEAGAGF